MATSVGGLSPAQAHNAGMCAGFTAGSGDGHNLVNWGTEDEVYLEIGDRTSGDSVIYANAAFPEFPGAARSGYAVVCSTYTGKHDEDALTGCAAPGAATRSWWRFPASGAGALARRPI